MKALIARPYLFGVAVAALVVSGCSGAGGGFQGGTALPASVHPDRARSWMDHRARENNLIYISDEGTNEVYVYQYESHVLRGTLTGFSSVGGECVDNKGDVFITSLSAAEIFEYAHGGTTPIATLNDAGEDPFSCSFDPKTGTLAVTNLFGSFGGGGSVSIYKNASGSPTNVTNSGFGNVYYAAYDNAGNLFIDGLDSSNSNFTFGEIPSGGTTLNLVTLSQSISWPGAIQWDGQYIALADQNAGVIYQLQSGSSITVKGSTTLTGGQNLGQFFIPRVGTSKNHVQGIHAIVALCGANDVGFWSYPAGGSAAAATIAGNGCPDGVVVSKGAMP